LAEMPLGSIAILNHDNPLLMQTATGVWSGETLTYGLEGGDIHGHLIDANTIQVGNVQFPLPLPGRHNALNYLAALATAKVLGLSWEALTAGVTVDMPGGRSRRLQLEPDIVLLDETYNAGLESMLASLQLLADTPGQRRIAVLGTMKELGDRAPEFHTQVGARAHQLGLDAVFVLADEPAAEAMAHGAAPLPSACFTNHTDLIHHLQHYMQPGDRVLFKASRSVGLDRVVAQLCPSEP
jgi:UDP-N-acetylmuramoyl-tripeptide--D-alanyl-D-alanine ligase